MRGNYNNFAIQFATHFLRFSFPTTSSEIPDKSTARRVAYENNSIHPKDLFLFGLKSVEGWKSEFSRLSRFSIFIPTFVV